MRERDFLENCGYCKKSKAEKTIAVFGSDGKLDIKDIIKRLDGLFAVEDINGAGELLYLSLANARRLGDKTGELSILSELMGFHRRTADKDAAILACREGIALIRELKIGNSISGATVLLNAATTLAAYGEPDEALEYFNEVLRVYSDNLDPYDYRFAGLYNNIGTAYMSAKNFERALEYYRAALSLVIKTENRPEIAVTHVNIAELYHEWDVPDSDERMDEHVKAAIAELESITERDGYYAFTCRKCAPTLDRLGYFFDAKRLNERADKIYAGN